MRPSPRSISSCANTNCRFEKFAPRRNSSPACPGSTAFWVFPCRNWANSRKHCLFSRKGSSRQPTPKYRRMCGLQLLRAYSGLKRDPDAVETALALNKLYPDDPEVLYHTGRIYGNFAYMVMTKLHDKAPNSIWMLQAQGEANEARKTTRPRSSRSITSWHSNPGATASIIEWAHLSVTIRRSTKAGGPGGRQARVQGRAGNRSRQWQCAYELASIQADLGNLEDARKLYEDVLESIRTSRRLSSGWGRPARFAEGGRGLAPLERATRINPDDDVAWYRLARAYRATGRLQDRARAFAEYRRIHSCYSWHSFQTQF